MQSSKENALEAMRRKVVGDVLLDLEHGESDLGLEGVANLSIKVHLPKKLQ